MRALVLIAALGALTSCGGSDSGDGSGGAPRVDAWGLPGGRPAPYVPPEVRSDSDLVLFVVVDGLSRDELAIHGADVRATPRIDALAAAAEVFESAVAVSTGGNAGIASMLTGLHPRQHGVGSLQDLGRASLAPGNTTLAEAFRDRGWSTIASLSSARHARGFSGFAQGFDVYEAPRIGEAPRSAAAVALGARDALDQAATTPGRGVFAFVVLGDRAERRRREPPPPERAAPFFEARLRPIADRRADVAAVLDRLALEPAAAQAELAEMLGRARGSEAARLYALAIRDAHLAEVDAAVGTLLDVIESAGRAETATVLLCAPRGRAPKSGEARVGPRFARSIVDVPLFVRWSRGASAGRRRPVTSVVDGVAQIDRAFGLELQRNRFTDRGVELLSNAAGTSFASVGSVQVERYGLDPSLTVFDRESGAVRDEWGAPTFIVEMFERFVEPASMALVRGSSAPVLDARWRAADGRVLTIGGGSDDDVPAAQRYNRIFGSARLDASEALDEVTIGLEARDTALQLDLVVAGEGVLDPREIVIGRVPLAELPVLYLPSDEGAPVAADAPRLFNVARAEGIWWKLSVAGEGPVEILAGTWPPRSPEDAMEVIAGGPVQRVDVPGRDDLVRLVGTAPFDLRIKRDGKEEFAFACRHGDRFLRPDELVVDDRTYGTPTALSLLVPSWQPAISDALGDVSGALYGNRASHAPIRIGRAGHGPVRGVDGALDSAQLQFLKTLLPGE